MNNKILYLLIIRKFLKTTCFNSLMIILGFSIGFGYMYFRYHLQVSVEHRHAQLEYLTSLVLEKHKLNEQIYECLDELSINHNIASIKHLIPAITNSTLKIQK